MRQPDQESRFIKAFASREANAARIANPTGPDPTSYLRGVVVSKVAEFSGIGVGVVGFDLFETAPEGSDTQKLGLGLMVLGMAGAVGAQLARGHLRTVRNVAIADHNAQAQPPAPGPQV
jgi:hypothetical protein